MRITKKFFLIAFTATFLLFVVKAQNDDKEESNIPRKVLRKYRIRRPIIIDQNGNAVTQPSTPKLRRIRVNKPQSTPSSQSNSIQTQYGNYQLNQQQPQALTQQQVVYDQPQVVEPVRVVPTYRKATDSSTRSALLANVKLKERGTGDEDTKKPVGTTRNYSRINEDGSFTFGYEGEDGSFKEETRGTDCVVRGKYGYVDPDGVQREFSYVSGNPCDPNATKQDETPEEEDEEAIPPIQRTPISRPRRPIINQEVSQNLEQVDTPTTPSRNGGQLVFFRTGPRQASQPVQSQPQFNQPTTFRPRIRITQPAQPTSTHSPFFQPSQLLGRSVQSTFNQPQQLTPQPALRAGPLLDERGANRAFNFEEEIQRVTLQEPERLRQPQQQQVQYYSHQPQQLQQQFPQTQPQPQQFNPQFEFPHFGSGSVHRFPQRQYFGGSNAPSLIQQHHYQTTTPPPTTPRPTLPTPIPQFQQRQILPQIQSNALEQTADYGNYRTELVFDPSTGRYTSVLVQDAPKDDEEFTLTQRLRGFIQPQQQQQQQQQPQFQMFGQPQVQYFPPQQQQQQQQPQQQQVYQQRPLFQNQFQFQPSTGSLTSFHSDAQEALNSPASGQIDAFLRNHNIQS